MLQTYNDPSVLFLISINRKYTPELPLRQNEAKNKSPTLSIINPAINIGKQITKTGSIKEIRVEVILFGFLQTQYGAINFILNTNLISLFITSLSILNPIPWRYS